MYLKAAIRATAMAVMAVIILMTGLSATGAAAVTPNVPAPATRVTARAMAPINLPRLLSPVPAAWTNNVLGTDQVHSVETVALALRPGDSTYEKMLHGGNFNAVARPGATKAGKNCSHFYERDFKSNTYSCWARFNGKVHSIVTTGDGNTAYVGGEFTTATAAGKTLNRSGVAKLNLRTRTIAPEFNAQLSGGNNRVRVFDLKIHRGYLVVAGAFTSVRGVARQALAAVTATGALSNYFNLGIGGSLSTTPVRVNRVAIRPQGDFAVIGGNFRWVGSKVRHRVAMVALGAHSASLGSWFAPDFGWACLATVPAYVRDVSFSPTGHEFVVGTTGHKTGTYPNLCDSTSVWPMNGSTNAKPRIVSYTHGDTITRVAHTGSVIYVGGHHRDENYKLYVNGKLQSTSPMKVSGISALSASTGRVIRTWGAARDRGIGISVFLGVPATRYHPRGMIVGSDTENWYVGGNKYHRERVAFLPMS